MVTKTDAITCALFFFLSVCAAHYFLLIKNLSSVEYNGNQLPRWACLRLRDCVRFFRCGWCAASGYSSHTTDPRIAVMNFMRNVIVHCVQTMRNGFFFFPFVEHAFESLFIFSCAVLKRRLFWKCCHYFSNCPIKMVKYWKWYWNNWRQPRSKKKDRGKKCYFMKNMRNFTPVFFFLRSFAFLRQKMLPIESGS